MGPGKANLPGVQDAKRDFGEPVELIRSDLRGLWPLGALAAVAIVIVARSGVRPFLALLFSTGFVLAFGVPVVLLRRRVGRNAIFLDDEGLIEVVRGRARRSAPFTGIREASWNVGTFWFGLDPAGILVTDPSGRRYRVGTIIIVRRRARRRAAGHVLSYLTPRLERPDILEEAGTEPLDDRQEPLARAPEEAEAVRAVPWWHGVLYHVYLRSFADSDGDGVGDIPGLIAKLDHLAALGVDGVWVSPVMPSPNEDYGYDVANYRAVDPTYGSLDDVARLVAEATKRGMRIVFDLVPNHTSDRHPWFVGARSSRVHSKRAWYVWRDPAPGGGPPNNWVSSFFGPAWELDERTGQYYLHSFLEAQPDLNWRNEEVREAFDEILRFWFDRGIAGFRIDVVHKMVKDADLRDNPPATDTDSFIERVWGQRELHNANQPGTHEVLRRWRRIGDGYAEQRILVGETYVFDPATLASYYGQADECHLAFNMPFLWSAFEAGAIRKTVEATLRALPEGAWPVWNGGSHDISRFPSRWCGGDPRKVRLAMMLLTTLRGTVLLYYGDEIGMLDGPVPPEIAKDPLARRAPVPTAGRDPCRTPMQWSATPGAGFTSPDATPWLPIGDASSANVETQSGDPGSVLELTRRLLRIRRSEPDIAAGAIRFRDAAPGVLAYDRGDRTTVALNLADQPATLHRVSGVVLAGTTTKRDGERVGGRLELEPWEGVVLYE
jgi:alpha-glucosidase